MKKLVLATAAVGALALGSLSFAAPGEAATAVYLGKPAVQSNVVDARCWRGRYGRWHCGPHYRHCWWRHGHRICRW
jgi:uncharacterized low-complexity protein